MGAVIVWSVEKYDLFSLIVKVKASYFNFPFSDEAYVGCYVDKRQDVMTHEFTSPSKNKLLIVFILSMNKTRAGHRQAQRACGMFLVIANGGHTGSLIQHVTCLFVY